MGRKGGRVSRYSNTSPWTGQSAVKVRGRRAWQGFAMLMVAQERQQGGGAEMCAVTSSSVQTRRHVGGGADAAASRIRNPIDDRCCDEGAKTRGAKTRLSWSLMPLAAQISMLHRPASCGGFANNGAAEALLAGTSCLTER